MTTNCFEHIATDRQGEVLVLTLTDKEVCEGVLVESLQQELSSAVQAEGVRNVVIDMHAVEFISSVGFGTLIRLRRTLAETGGKLVLCCFSAFVRKVFFTACLVDAPDCRGSMFLYADSVAEALQKISDNA